MGGLTLRHLLRSAFRDNVPASCSAFRTEIDHPVCRLDHIQIVFDYDEGVAGVDKFMQDGKELS